MLPVLPARPPHHSSRDVSKITEFRRMLINMYAFQENRLKGTTYAGSFLATALACPSYERTDLFNDENAIRSIPSTRDRV